MTNIERVKKEYLLQSYDFECFPISTWWFLLYGETHHVFMHRDNIYCHLKEIGDNSHMCFFAKSLEDISFLINMNMGKIEKLDFSENSVSDISIMKDLNLENLDTLHLDSNLLEDISVFSGLCLPKLKYLSLDTNQIKDFSPLLNVDLPSLVRLDLVRSDFFAENEQNVLDPNLEVKLKCKFKGATINIC